MAQAPHEELGGHVVAVLDVKAKLEGKVSVLSCNVACVGQWLAE